MDLVTRFVCNIDRIGVIHCLKYGLQFVSHVFSLLSLVASLSLSLSLVEEEIVYSLSSLLVLLLFFVLFFWGYIL